MNPKEFIDNQIIRELSDAGFYKSLEAVRRHLRQSGGESARPGGGTLDSHPALLTVAETLYLKGRLCLVMYLHPMTSTPPGGKRRHCGR